MDLYNIGFSNIRLPNSKKSYTYKYNSIVNTFPEEVFLHEFLHSLERTLNEYEYSIPALHDYEQYGYRDEEMIGQKVWYQDYMRKRVKYGSEYVGLDPIVYTIKPIHNSDFSYSTELVFHKKDKNIIEDIIDLIAQIKNAF